MAALQSLSNVAETSSTVFVKPNENNGCKKAAWRQWIVAPTNFTLDTRCGNNQHRPYYGVILGRLGTWKMDLELFGQGAWELVGSSGFSNTIVNVFICFSFLFPSCAFRRMKTLVKVGSSLSRMEICESPVTFAYFHWKMKYEIRDSRPPSTLHLPLAGSIGMGFITISNQKHNNIRLLVPL